MRRVVVTGMGIVCSIGNNKAEVLDSLKAGRSGITFQPEYEARGLRSHVAGSVKNLDVEALIDRKLMRFMADGHAYAWLAMQEAIADAGLTEDKVSNLRTGLIVGAGGASHVSISQGIDTLKEKGVKRVGPYMVTKAMASGVSACLGHGCKNQRRQLQHQLGLCHQCALHWRSCRTNSAGQTRRDVCGWRGRRRLDAVVHVRCHGCPVQQIQRHSRKGVTHIRCGPRWLSSSLAGGGILVLEEYEHAKARGAKIYAELVGYGATSDGYDMVAPSGEGALRCMKMALLDTNGKDVGPVDYVNTHGTSTPVGDVKEIEAIRAVFADGSQTPVPHIASTKSLTGHALGGSWCERSHLHTADDGKQFHCGFCQH
jgi:3-oxoacyl-[acyl-carrier-protein] synthase-1